MITRAQIRRQLRASGGIMNVTPREKFGIGSSFQKFKDKVVDRTRKIIPNELADIAVKAAPFVAPFNPGIAGLMRGIGRLDQRGNLMDAFKQGALTYGFGKGVGKLGGASGSELGNVFGRQQYSMEGFREGPIGRMFQGGKETGDMKPPGTDPTPPTEPKSIMRKMTDKVFEKVPFSDKLDQIVKEKLLVGGITAAGSYLYEKFIEGYPDPEPGEDMEKYLAERKQRVGAQMRTYMDNYFANDPEYMKLDDAGRNEFVSRYNVRDGGRIGYQTGGISMANTLQQNIERNRQQATGIQSMLNAARKKAGLPTIQPKTQPQTMVPVGPITISRMEEEPQKNIENPNVVDLNYNPPKKLNPIGKFPTPPGGDVQPISRPGAEPITNLPESGAPGTEDIMSGYDDFISETYGDGPFMSTADVRSYRLPDGTIQEGSSTSMGRLNAYLKSIGQPPVTDVNTFSGVDLQQVQPGEPGLRAGINTGGKFTDLQRPREPMMDPNFQNLSPQEQDAAMEKFRKGTDAYIKRFGSFADGREIDPMQGRSSYRDILNAIQTDHPDIYKTLKGDETLAELDQKMLDLQNRKGAAKGGIMSMPMGQPRVNQGGVTELDYRAKGGFVPVGIKEKEDDVPAMLSKNEFVFTADAVRGAGNGSIEKGAQKMYNTMKNLERRVT